MNIIYNFYDEIEQNKNNILQIFYILMITF